ncbi:MAG TPA: rod shape-determining protein MreC [Thermodesulfobacteriota bacterium]|nr:rod shape-determining protein MreC [Thermodesulfobacteriota bacterium]
MSIITIKYRQTLLYFLLVIAALSFFLFNLRSSIGTGAVQKGFFSLSSEFHQVANAIMSFPVDLWSKYVFLLNTEETKRLLAEENKRLVQENIMLREAAMANQRLREMLDFEKNSSLNLLATEVVGVDASLYYQSVFIDKGEIDGVKKDMAVISPSGVVGKILKTSTYSSMVILLIDQNFALDALIQETRTKGVIEGTGTAQCKLKYVLSLEKPQEGNLVVTSGLEGFFPKGMLVGKIASLNEATGTIFQDIIVQPTVNFDKLEEVFVVLQ